MCDSDYNRLREWGIQSKYLCGMKCEKMEKWIEIMGVETKTRCVMYDKGVWQSVQ